MFEHVAMEQPEPGVICNKNQISLLASLEQIGVTFSIKERPVFLLYPKVMAVEMHGVVPACVIPDLNADRLADIDLC